MDTCRKIIPLGNKILVGPITTVEQGGIIIPEAYRESHDSSARIWNVIRVGPKVKDISPGDRVLAHSYTAGPIDLSDGLKMLTEDQVLAVL